MRRITLCLSVLSIALTCDALAQTANNDAKCVRDNPGLADSNYKECNDPTYDRRPIRQKSSGDNSPNIIGNGNTLTIGK